MAPRPRFTHVALTVSRELFEEERRAELLAFYAEIFGWRENTELAIPNQRIFLRAPSDTQYITLRAASAPMSTSGYEHLGVEVSSEAELRALHERATRAASRYPGLELGPIQTEYAGRLQTFRLRFRLPLTLELQHFAARRTDEKPEGR